MPSSGDKTPTGPRPRKRKNVVEEAIINLVQQQEPEDEETLFGKKCLKVILNTVDARL